MTQEMVALREALAHFDELGLSGGVLRKNGNIVAFTIGEALNSDTFVYILKGAAGSAGGISHDQSAVRAARL